MKILALFLCAGLMGGVARAEDIGTVSDRHGVILMELRTDSHGALQRTYPFGALAIHVLEGLENKVLPKAGETLFLTLDAQIQYAAEMALRKVPRGAAVLLDAKNGDILAMASVPSFDLMKSGEDVEGDDGLAPHRNRALWAYPPGGTFLPVTALAGLASGMENFHHTCTGSIKINDHVMKCWIGVKGDGHGDQTLRDGMKNSCNTFFYQYGIAAGPEKIGSMATLLGLGKPSGVPLSGEASGLVPGKEYLKKFSARETWSEGYTANMAIGQGMLLVTPLQMASVAATIGNGGTVIRPRLIDRLVREDKKAVRKDHGIVAQLTDAGVSKENLDLLQSAMWASVNESPGNARRVATPGFQVAARTGTSQNRRKGLPDTVTALVGFADAGDTQYAFSIWVEGAKSGGGVAAPVAALILGGIARQEGPRRVEPAPGSFNFVESVE